MGRVRREGREWVWVMEVMEVCVSVRVVLGVVVDGEEEVGVEWWNEMREREG